MRLTDKELDAIATSLAFILAGEFDESAGDDADREVYEAALGKIAKSRAARRAKPSLTASRK